MADVRLTATNPEDSSVVPVACNEKGELKLEEPLVVDGPQGPQGEPGPKGEDGRDGDPFSGNFDGNVTFNGDVVISRSAQASYYLCDPRPMVLNPGFKDYVPPEGVWTNFYGMNFSGERSAAIYADGSVDFASRKAGFTVEGYLWCTTTRGDTVILEATVGGAGLWAAYTPPTRRDRLKELAEEHKTRPKPEESSRDEPENPQ